MYSGLSAVGLIDAEQMNARMTSCVVGQLDEIEE